MTVLVLEQDLDLAEWFTLQGTVEKEEVGASGRPVRKVSQNRIDYSLMLGSDKDERECRTPRQKAQEEEEIEGWVKAIVDMQQRRSVLPFVPAPVWVETFCCQSFIFLALLQVSETLLQQVFCLFFCCRI